MYCRNCGAQFQDTESHCPYCGTLNLLQAESAYMEKLEDIREDTEDLGKLPSEACSHQLKTHGKFALKTALIVIGICLGVFLIIQTDLYISEKKDRAYLKQAAEFRKNYFSPLNEIYSAGDDQATYEYLTELYEIDGCGELVNWEHHTYFLYYEYHTDIETLKAAISNHTDTDTLWTIAFYSALLLSQEDISENDKFSLTSEEIAKIRDFQKEASEFLTNYMELDAKEQKEVYENCCKDGFLDYTLCKKYILKFKERLED